MYLCYIFYSATTILYFSWESSQLDLRNSLTDFVGGNFVALLTFSTSLFGYSYFVTMNKQFNKIILLSKVVAGIQLMNLLQSFIFHSITVVQFIAITNLYIFPIGVYLALKTRIMYNYLFVIGWFAFGAGSILFGLGHAGIVSFSVIPFGNQVILFATSIENLFMLLAIGHRVYTTEKNRYQAHSRLNHSYSQLAKVFYHHQISQIQAGAQLESTMKTNLGSGIVMSFDIIGSSKIHHKNLREFLESAIHDCTAILTENYSDKDMAANRYRVKEMGDGFLCSIGYPLASPHKGSDADLSLKLARRFIKT